VTVGIPGTLLITGASGQVGSALVRLLKSVAPDVSAVAPTRTEMNLFDAGSIRSYVRTTVPRWIVNCGAYTAVDAAEADQSNAFAANAIAPGVLAEEAFATGAGLIHLSTDYVFDGSGTRPWVESDATGPRNIYGASKLAGEKAIAAAGTPSSPYLILRTSWVYSDEGKNFVRTMMRLLSTRTDPLKVVADQHGAPTSAADLASTVLSLITHAETTALQHQGSLAAALDGVSGLYHCAGTGETTWAGLAGAVRSFLEREHGLHPPAIIPVPTTAYPTPAPRPLNSRLNCTKLYSKFGIEMPEWSESVTQVCRALAAIDLSRPVESNSA
jgi:dTDP-4-dehydrorhamnose reductase